MKRLLEIFSLAVSIATAAYSPIIGLKGVYYSAATHCSVTSLNAWNCGEPCTQLAGVTNMNLVVNDAKGTFGFVAYNKNSNEIVVSFRGSTNIENWITNIDFVMKTYKDVAGAQVHEGFFSAYDAVSGQVISAVKSILSVHPTATLFVTGHSLGGALATFAAVDIKRTIATNNKITLYSYGSPRTGN